MRKSEYPFQIVVILILTLCGVLVVAPLVLLFVASLSGEAAVGKQGFRFWPRGWSLDAYRSLLKWEGVHELRRYGARFARAYGVTITATALGTALHLLIAPMLAWPLARRDYARRKAATMLVILPLALSGGMFPAYVVWAKVFRVQNTIWAYVLPHLVLTPWQVLLYRQFFRANFSRALLDAAKLDGAGEWRVYFGVVLPQSLPLLAAMGLLTAAAYWSDWYNAVFYITDRKWHSVQALTKEIIDSMRSFAVLGPEGPPPTALQRTAACVVALLPTLAALPLLSRAYTRVIRLGTVKT